MGSATSWFWIWQLHPGLELEWEEVANRVGSNSHPNWNELFKSVTRDEDKARAQCKGLGFHI